MTARVHLGVVLPQIPTAPRQAVLELEPSASMPAGYRLSNEPGGLILVRERDGARLGTMVSVEFACDHAAVLAREEARRAELEGA